ncbi:MAG: hypothetical protein ACJ74U_20585, partial [Jatrophihabitantaceae bacterium]
MVDMSDSVGMMSDSVGMALDRPMPRADVATARLAGLRAAELAAELHRVHAALAGLLGRAAGWSGSAELAFQDSLAAELSRFSPAEQRYEGYAAALTGYARELDRLAPGLVASRARLSAGVAVSVGEFERWWGQWEVARGRCVAGLVAAAGVGADRRGGGWSGLLHGVAGVVPHPGLVGLSRALGELGQALVVAGVVLALVCPPAAGVVWGAVAVVAVCQLAVDVARRGRGERVGAGRLGWDVLAVLPVGRVAAGAHSAVAA